MYPSSVQCFTFQNTSVCLLSHFILPETSEASIITPLFSLEQWLMKDKWNAHGYSYYPKGQKPRSDCFLVGLFPWSHTVWTGHTALRSFPHCNSWDDHCLFTGSCWSLRTVSALLVGMHLPFSRYVAGRQGVGLESSEGDTLAKLQEFQSQASGAWTRDELARVLANRWEWKGAGSLRRTETPGALSTGPMTAHKSWLKLLPAPCSQGPCRNSF